MKKRDKTTTINFRLLSIKPLEGCDSRYRKNLSEGVEYKFYDDITTSLNLYNRGELNVNFSAIVGKNGSGKSTIIELLIRLINNFYAKYGNDPEKDVFFVPDLNVELIFEEEYRYKVQSYNNEITVYRYDNELVRLTEDKIRKLEFFYSIVVNYSHYAYNEHDLNSEGEWIGKLFHKNDGYQLPIVLNPYREEGNIDINSEKDLLYARLLSNILNPKNVADRNLRSIREGLKIEKMILTIDQKKTKKKLYDLMEVDPENARKVKNVGVFLKDLKVDREAVFKKLERYSDIDLQTFEDSDDLITDYIVYKLVNISLKYKDYRVFFDKANMKFRDENLDTYFELLFERDPSHIVFKLKQVFNFIKHRYLDLEDRHEYGIDEIAGKIEPHIKEEWERIEFLPPPIFKIDLQLSAKGNDEVIYFSQLSSGEKQRIFSISSLTYHLLNLDSIVRTGNRRPYKYINIILEEIELYFHPEMQRMFVCDVLWTIRALPLQRIKAINFCLVTHSPFVLSDIPKSNVLFLKENGEPDKEIPENTFGGNVHDLLAHSFFLDKGMIGEFAKVKIKKVIEFLQPEARRKETSNGADDDSLTQENAEQIISLIGEPFLRDKLADMFEGKFQRKPKR